MLSSSCAQDWPDQCHLCDSAEPPSCPNADGLTATMKLKPSHSASQKIINSPLPSSSTITPTPTMILSPPSSKQVFNVSEWTIETDRVSTSNTLFSSMVEPAPGMSFRESGRDLHIPGAYDNYYDVIDVSDFQPPPEPLQPS